MKIDLSNDQLLVEETLYFTGNGYIGIRANFEEGYKEGYDTIRGAYINGFYETHPITYGESAYGFPTSGQRMVNVMDGQGIRLSIDGDTFSMFEGKVKQYERGLEIYEGYAFRLVEWVSPKGHRLILRFRRMTSFYLKELAVLSVEIQSVNYTGPVKIVSSVKGNVTNYTNPNDPRVGSGDGILLGGQEIQLLSGMVGMKAQTLHSNIPVGLCVAHEPRIFDEITGKHTEGITEIWVEPGVKKDFHKLLVYTDDLRHEDVIEDGFKILDQALEIGVEGLYQKQKEYLEHFWTYAKVDISEAKHLSFGDDHKVEDSINYCVYQLLASAGRSEHSQISAKGLSGEGYEGHYFWDTEIYMIPFFTLVHKDIAKKLLDFRYNTLDAARERALEMGHKKGAKIPWRTIAGTECSAFFPAGSAQYHINADVAYALIQYYLYTKDLSYMIDKGFEVLLETARIWLDMGTYDRTHKFNIHGVTGPDEYTALVSNNYYTNSMAKYHLEWVVKLYEKIRKSAPNVIETYKKQLKLNKEEMDGFVEAAKAMVIPYDETLNIHLQDESFLNKAEWQEALDDKIKRPLLLHYHPLAIYRHQVLKQADTVLSHFLLDDVDFAIMESSYKFYEQRTTHDSSLSPCVYSMMASRLNYGEKAYQYYMKTLRLDLDNLHHNTKDGLHIANAGGAYMGIVYGFGGLRIHEDGLCIRPLKPKEWSSITFRLNYNEGLVTITLGSCIRITTTKEIDLKIYNKGYRIDHSLEVPYEKL